MPVLCRATSAVTCDALCSIVLEENPLADFVELPEHLQDLRCITHLRPPPAALAVLPRVPRRDM